MRPECGFIACPSRRGPRGPCQGCCCPRFGRPTDVLVAALCLCAKKGVEVMTKKFLMRPRPALTTQPTLRDDAPVEGPSFAVRARRDSCHGGVPPVGGKFSARRRDPGRSEQIVMPRRSIRYKRSSRRTRGRSRPDVAARLARRKVRGPGRHHQGLSCSSRTTSRSPWARFATPQAPDRRDRQPGWASPGLITKEGSTT